MSQTDLSLRDAAIQYAEAGIPVFPCVPGKKRPITPNGFHDASTDVKTIESWWAMHPDANIATPTGTKGGIGVTIDIDGADNPWPEDPALRESLEKGVTVITPSGGRHHHFKFSEDNPWGITTSKIAPNVDTRGIGGYVLLPPSIISNEGEYRYA